MHHLLVELIMPTGRQMQNIILIVMRDLFKNSKS
jgi:hypothetical protein